MKKSSGIDQGMQNIIQAGKKQYKQTHIASNMVFIFIPQFAGNCYNVLWVNLNFTSVVIKPSSFPLVTKKLIIKATFFDKSFIFTTCVEIANCFNTF